MPLKEVAKLGDVPEGAMKHIEVANLEILLANVEGKIYAVGDRCGHMNAPLSMGTLKGKIVKCPLHHAQFDVTAGKRIRGPQLGGLTGRLIARSKAGKLMAAIKTYDLKTYDVKVEGELIKIKL